MSTLVLPRTTLKLSLLTGRGQPLPVAFAVLSVLRQFLALLGFLCGLQRAFQRFQRLARRSALTDHASVVTLGGGIPNISTVPSYIFFVTPPSRDQVRP